MHRKSGFNKRDRRAVIAMVVCILSLGLMLSACNSVFDLTNLVMPAKTNSKDAMLDKAIRYDDYEAVKEAIEAGANATVITYENAISEKSSSVMLWAIERGVSDNIIKYLFENGSDPNYADRYGITLLMSSVGASGTNRYLANYNDLKFTRILLDYGADVNRKDNRGNSALDYALQFGDLEKREQCQKMLLESGSDVDEKTVKLLEHMIRSNRVIYDEMKTYVISEIFEKAKKQGMKTNVDAALQEMIFDNVTEANKLIRMGKYDKRHIDPLLYFISAKGTIESMELLGEREKSTLKDFDTALFMLSTAAEYGNVEVMSYIFDESNIPVNPESEDPDIVFPLSPLDYAVKNGQYEAAKYLLGKGASLTVTGDHDDENDTLRLAAEAPNSEKILPLLFDFQNRNIPKKSYLEAIYGAIESSNEYALRYLLEQAAQTGYSFESKALIKVCARSFEDDGAGLGMMNLLLESGANVNGSDNEKSSMCGEPLSNAAKNGNIKAVRYLIGRGADVNAWSSYREESPLGAAINYGFLDIVKVLIENGAAAGKDFDWEWYRKTGSQRIYDYLKSANAQE